jgi:hypothetical protein
MAIARPTSAAAGGTAIALRVDHTSVAGDDPLMGQYGFLWQAELKRAALAMMRAKRGLVVEVTENDIIGGGGNPMSQAVKMAPRLNSVPAG